MLSQRLAGLNASACDAYLDAAIREQLATERVVITFIGVQLARTASGWPFLAVIDLGNGIHQLLQHLAVVHVGSRNQNHQRRPLRVYGDVSFGTQFTPVRRIGPDFLGRFLGPEGAGSAPFFVAPLGA